MRILTSLLAVGILALPTMAAPPVAPGDGVKVPAVGDDFESHDWDYIRNGNKASYEQDEMQRPPGGKSRNGRFFESAKRGQPDVVRRIRTPPGGLRGSSGSLLLATRFSGIPGELANQQMQDDLLLGIKGQLGRPLSPTWRPSCVVRVFLPDFHRWENRTGASFGIRADVRGRGPDGEVEPYWPGFFILFRSETDRRFDHDYAQISIRAREDGRDVAGPIIEEPGWWTFGMSFTPDGRVHFYASEGTDDLTEEDHLLSSFPYRSKCLYLDNVFFNVANFENGRNWSTPWVIDDPSVYVIPPRGQTVEQLVRNRYLRDGRQRSRVSSASRHTPGSRHPTR